MVCPYCGTTFEGRFCPGCGRDMFVPAFVCGRCGAVFTGYACPYCGTPVRAGTGAGFRAVGSIVWTFGTIAFFLLVVLDLIGFLYASSLIVNGALAGGPRYIELYVLLPFPVGQLIEADAGVFLAYFALIAATILGACGWYAVRDAKVTAQAFNRPLADLRPRMESRSAWIATGQVFMAALFFQVFYIAMLWAAGYVPPNPAQRGVPDWYPYFALANASVYEEIVSRWLLIGVPLTAAAIALRRRLPADQTVPAWRHLFGGTLHRDSPAPLVVLSAILVLASSVVFGLAHVPGWGWWKFLPSMVAGLGMGYLFVRRGLLAGVLFHFANDYFAGIALLTQDNLAAQVLIGLFLLVLIGLGTFFFVWYFVYLIGLAGHWAVKWGLRKPEPAPTYPSAPPVQSGGALPWFAAVDRAASQFPPPPPSPPGYPPPPAPAPLPGAASEVPWYGGGFVAFQCPQCGGREARYDAGRFTCLRCGRAT